MSTLESELADLGNVTVPTALLARTWLAVLGKLSTGDEAAESPESPNIAAQGPVVRGADSFSPDAPDGPRSAPIRGAGCPGGGLRTHLEAIEAQTRKNDARWSGYPCSPAEHLLILTEEIGEVARAMQTQGEGNSGYQWPPAYSPEVYDELVDAAAVILAMMRECVE